MGKRKILFDLRKNSDEKRRKVNEKRRKVNEKLIVSIPLKLIEPPPLLVTLPIAAYSTSKVSNLTILRSRLETFLSPGWVIADENTSVCPTTSSSALFLYKLLSFTTGVVYLLSINSDFSWELKAGDSFISQDIEVLRNCSLFVSSVNLVIQLLNQIDHATFCVGNVDSKFSKLVAIHKECFKDVSGKYIIILHNYL